MKQKVFEIESNRITMFPNEIWKMAGYAVAIVFPACWLALLVWGGLFQWFALLYMTVGNTIILLPFFYAGSRQIVIDGNTQMVLRKSWFGLSKACNFCDVADVQLVNIAVYKNHRNNYYKLALKKNPYGSGIQLNMAINKTTKQFETIQNTAIPFIKKLLATNSNYTDSNKPNWIEAEAAGFKMFYQKDGTFISKPLKTINLMVAVLLLGLGLYIIFSSPANAEPKKEYYWLLVVFFAVIVNVGMWGERIKIIPADKTIEKSYIGLLKKKYVYKRIAGFNTLKHINGLDNPIDIRIEMDNGVILQQITLFSKVGSAKKTYILMDELKRILTG